MYEGLRLSAYKCQAGVWTIGYGHTKAVTKGDVITEEKAEELLLDDLSIFEKGVSSLVKVELNENQFSALVSLAFNIGLGNFQKSTLLRLINAGDFPSASKEFTRWSYAKRTTA